MSPPVDQGAEAEGAFSEILIGRSLLEGVTSRFTIVSGRHRRGTTLHAAGFKPAFAQRNERAERSAHLFHDRTDESNLGTVHSLLHIYQK